MVLKFVFSRQPNGQWHREQIVGATSEQRVQALIARARNAQLAKAVAVAGSAIGN